MTEIHKMQNIDWRDIYAHHCGDGAIRMLDRPCADRSEESKNDALAIIVPAEEGYCRVLSDGVDSFQTSWENALDLAASIAAWTLDRAEEAVEDDGMSCANVACQCELSPATTGIISESDTGWRRSESGSLQRAASGFVAEVLQEKKYGRTLSRVRLCQKRGNDLHVLIDSVGRETTDEAKWHAESHLSALVRKMQGPPVGLRPKPSSIACMN